jgi:hypothetical protein
MSWPFFLRAYGREIGFVVDDEQTFFGEAWVEGSYGVEEAIQIVVFFFRDQDEFLIQLVTGEAGGP